MSEQTTELSERLLRVAILGLIPDDDPHIIADAQGEMEDLRADLAVAAKEIERLRAEVERLHTELGHRRISDEVEW